MTDTAGATEQGEAVQIILSDFISVDGVVQAPGGPEEDTDGGFAHGGWSMQYFDPEAMGPEITSVMQRTDALLFGRRTFNVMAGAWPDRAGDPFADWMNSVPKYVVSSTLRPEDVTWENSTLLDPADPLAAIRELRERDGHGLQVMGSASLARMLVEHDLVDEYGLMIEPLLLGGGKTIFPQDGNARPLELVSCNTTATGVIMARYRRVRD
jgi:dihydrofolate reductase